jgi:hypothetical protein
MNYMQQLTGRGMGGFPLGSVDAKHSNAWHTYGYPSAVTFLMYYTMYKRSGLGRRLIDIRVDTTWSQFPDVAINPEDPNDPLRAQFNTLCERHNLWATFAELDRRQSVGRWGGAFLELADGATDLSQPVGTVSGGLNGLQAVKVFYESQLDPSEWNQDQTSPRYGTPTKYNLNEREIGSTNNDTGRSGTVDASRVVIWAEGSTGYYDIYGTSAMEAAFNALIDYEKIRGAGGEGFWKNAKGMLQIVFNDPAALSQIQQLYGGTPEEAQKKFKEKWELFIQSFDSALSVAGAEAKSINTSLIDPSPFAEVAKVDIATSIGCPLTIFSGEQMSQRASNEDKSQWAKQIEARRQFFATPALRKVINQLMDVGVLRSAEQYEIKWPDLQSPSKRDKSEVLEILARAAAQLGGNLDMGVLAKVAGLDEDDVYQLGEMQSGTMYDLGELE